MYEQEPVGDLKVSKIDILLSQIRDIIALSIIAFYGKSNTIILMVSMEHTS